MGKIIGGIDVELLLAAAKRSVEMAIEEDETTAETWLRSEAERLGVKL